MTDLTYSDKADPERTGLYLYGVVPSKGSNGEPLVVAEPGLDGAAVQVVASGDIGILTHACAPVPYEGGVAQIHAWVLAQHEVIKSAHAQAGTILPIRFNSIVAATDRGAAQILVDWLERCHDELAAQLDALRDRVELGVQLFAGRVPTGATADADSEATGSVSRGRGYFQAQLAARQERERSRAAEALTAQTVFDDLTRLCEEIVVNPKRPAREGVQAAEAGQSGQRMLLDVAVLVQPDQVSRIGEYLGEIDQTPGLSVRFTGPWAPYAFVGAFDMPLLVPAHSGPTTDKGEHDDA